MGIAARRSFTLIELVVAVGVIGLILPAVFNIFFVMIRQQLVLVSYQEMKQQGDSAERNIKNILQNRAAFITNSDNTQTDVCPVIPIPTPTNSPHLYINDRDQNSIHLFQETIVGVDTIASYSASMDKKYPLTSKDVTISNLGFTCHHINDFTPSVVSVTFVVGKSTVFNKSISLPYSFNVRLRNY